MSSIAQYSRNSNHMGKDLPTILSTIDLIDHMVDHHHEQAIELVELAVRHEQQAAALAAERRALAAEVSATLAEAEGLLR